MGILQNILPSINVLFGRTDHLIEILLAANVNAKFDISKAEGLSTVYTCVKILSDTISRLPVGVYQASDKGRTKEVDHYLYDLIHYNPNSYTNSQTFFSALETIRNLRGNSFALIHRNSGTGKIIGLELLNNEVGLNTYVNHGNINSSVKGYSLVNGELFYKVELCEGNKREIADIPSNDILHFRGLTKNGIWGLNPIEALRLNLSITHQSLTTVDSLYTNKAMAPQALSSKISGANQKAMLEAQENFAKKNSGPTAAGKMLVLPPNTELQNLSMSMADAEFITTVKFNANQIAALYGVPAFMIGNHEASKYSNIEQTQISFKVNTVSPITRMYRQEMEFKLLTTAERKLGKSIEFNMMAMVETDSKTRFEGYKVLSSIGAISPNKIAALEGLETFKGGDLHYVQTQQLVPLEQAQEKTMERKLDIDERKLKLEERKLELQELKLNGQAV